MYPLKFSLFEYPATAELITLRKGLFHIHHFLVFLTCISNATLYANKNVTEGSPRNEVGLLKIEGHNVEKKSTFRVINLSLDTTTVIKITVYRLKWNSSGILSDFFFTITNGAENFRSTSTLSSGVTPVRE